MAANPADQHSQALSANNEHLGISSTLYFGRPGVHNSGFREEMPERRIDYDRLSDMLTQPKQKIRNDSTYYKCLRYSRPRELCNRLDN